MTQVSGAWRSISKEEAALLCAQGANVDWAEGIGLIVYDQQALDEMEAAREAGSIYHRRSSGSELRPAVSVGRDDLHRPVSTRVVREIIETVTATALPGLIIIGSFVAGFAAGIQWAAL